jgi:hypothetical protein
MDGTKKLRVNIVIPIDSREIVDKVIVIQEALSIADRSIRKYFKNPSKLFIKLGCIRALKEDIPQIKLLIDSVICSFPWTNHTNNLEFQDLKRKRFRLKCQKDKCSKHRTICSDKVYIKVMDEKILQALRKALRIKLGKNDSAKKWELWEPHKDEEEYNGHNSYCDEWFDWHERNESLDKYIPKITIMKFKKSKRSMYAPNCNIFFPWRKHRFGALSLFDSFKIQLIGSKKKNYSVFEEINCVTR